MGLLNLAVDENAPLGLMRGVGDSDNLKLVESRVIDWGLACDIHIMDLTLKHIMLFKQRSEQLKDELLCACTNNQEMHDKLSLGAATLHQAVDCAVDELGQAELYEFAIGGISLVGQLTRMAVSLHTVSREAGISLDKSKQQVVQAYVDVVATIKLTDDDSCRSFISWLTDEVQRVKMLDVYVTTELAKLKHAARTTTGPTDLSEEQMNAMLSQLDGGQHHA